jgi:hypothetical protein
MSSRTADVPVRSTFDSEQHPSSTTSFDLAASADKDVRGPGRTARARSRTQPFSVSPGEREQLAEHRWPQDPMKAEDRSSSLPFLAHVREGGQGEGEQGRRIHKLCPVHRNPRFVVALLLASALFSHAAVQLDEQAVDPSAGDLPAYRITTPAATWFLEKSGAGLSSLVDREGRDWLGFHPGPGSGAGGEYRGFPNAVHQQAGNYFHARNQATDPAITRVEHAGPERVTISAVSSNGLWACRYDFFATHCTFTVTRMPADRRYWVLYEGTPGGAFDDDDWWMTSAVQEPRPMTVNHEGDIPAPEWIAFGDPRVARAVFLVHHEDDAHPDRFYQMQRKMTVFGFGRKGIDKFLDSVPQRFSIGFVEGTAGRPPSHAEIAARVQDVLNAK